ncbi:MAG TPA: hypothetical protein VEQ63_10955 [Bryobacteraceae bacterium]|nr:hypothetical protein [Bryobacteraceae bacterium]
MALCAVAAFAADFNGKWVGSWEGPNGKIENTYDFKVEGTTLTGTVSSPRGESKIQEGKVDGESISFVVVRNFNGNEVKQNYTGKLTGEDLKLNASFGDRQIDITAKRAK